MLHANIRTCLLNRLNNIKDNLGSETDLLEYVYSGKIPQSYYSVFNMLSFIKLDELSDMRLLLFCGYCYHSLHAADVKALSSELIISINLFNDFVFELITKSTKEV